MNQLLMMLENFKKHLDHAGPDDMVFDTRFHKQLGFKYICMTCLKCGNNTGYNME